MTTRFDFENPAGERLSGRLDEPEGSPLAWALFAHCFTCGKDNIAATRISRDLASAGIGTLRFDFTGLGASDGSFGNGGFSSDVQDLLAAAAAMAGAGIAPSLLIGHSFGGAAVLAAAAAIKSARAVVTIAAPFEIDHVLHQFRPADLATIRRQGHAEVALGGRSFRIGKAFLDHLTAPAPETTIGSLRRALLVLHSPTDQTVGIGNASRIFAAAKHPKSFISLGDADHLLSRRSDAAYVAAVVSAWAQPYLRP